ncbi:MAG: DUF4397 domain-containing protein [Gemmatimonadaceae bacterium]|nr:DUF4397 domain-containing protein [Gemmatimonadaceae bacterium]
MTSSHITMPHHPARRLPWLALLAAAVVAACGTEKAAGPLQPSGTQGRVRFVNLINDTTRGRVNAILEQLPFGVNLTYTASTPISLAAPNTAPYAAILTGDRTLVLKRTADTSVTVASFTFNIVEGQDKSIYAIGGAAASAITQFATVDTNPAPPATQSRLRLVHLSPTAGNIDLFVTAVGADLAAATPTLSNVAFRAASAYFTVVPGTYQIRAVPAGTAAAQRAASVSINVASQAFTGGTGRTIVAADNTTGGAPLRAFILTDR